MPVMNPDSIGLLELLLTTAGGVLTLVILLGTMLWRMHAGQTKRIDRVSNRIDQVATDLRKDLGGRIDQVNGRIDQVNGRIDRVASDLGGRIDQVNGRIDKVATGLSNLDSRLARIEGRLSPSPWDEARPEEQGVGAHSASLEVPAG